MPAAVNTGVPLQGGTVNAPGYEQQSANTFFDSQSTSGISHLIDITEIPYYIKAFGLDDAGFVQVVKCTKTPTGELQEDLQLGGVFVALIKANTMLVIDIPGLYRLKTASVGTVTVVGGPTNMSYNSFGLKAFVEIANMGTLGETINGIVNPS